MLGASGAEKRNRYLEEAAKDDIDLLIVADSDHYFVGDWPAFAHAAVQMIFEDVPDCPAFRIPILTRGNDGVYRYVLVSWIFQPKMVHYQDTHDGYYGPDGARIIPKSCPILADIMMINDHSIRTQTRTDEGISYKLLNRKKEGKPV